MLSIVASLSLPNNIRLDCKSIKINITVKSVILVGLEGTLTGGWFAQQKLYLRSNKMC